MRLFTALWPPPATVDHLHAAVRAVDEPRWRAATAGLRGFRLLEPERWHLTLCFHGDSADLDRISEELDGRIADEVRTAGDSPQPPERGTRESGATAMLAPRLRLGAGGTFRGVLWVAVEPAGELAAERLRSLVRASGGDPDGFRAHVTVGRWRSGRGNRRLADLLRDYRGPWWTASELVVVRSDLTETEPRYEAVRRVELAGDGG